ncbi:phosphoesterase [Pectobacterium phage My1]|uniref:Putative serine/threonine protein phosphatase 1 n=1 Tax=Pectobacterium phage My1 TaxID=1204539 RepID=J9QPR1_9CAUD|nr:phosphoesterase [Pectobacterium phage My1]AFQ22191.1 putative serine/threonine protein phosphatase 1 [Pectobacterium phage My1]
MTKVLVWSDLHLDHPNAHKWRPWLGSSMKEHDEAVLELLSNSIDRKNMVIELLGDVCVGRNGIAALHKVLQFKGSRIPCNLRMGNHDAEREGITVSELSSVFNEITLQRKKSGLLYSHVPCHPLQLRDNICVHGHVHDESIPDSRYINVSLEMLPNGPIDAEVIKEGEHVTWNKTVDLTSGRIFVDRTVKDQKNSEIARFKGWQ